MKLGRHFLSRLRHRLDKANEKNNKHARIHLNHTIIKDLELWSSFLKKAYDGVNMNLLVFREPKMVFKLMNANME